MFVLLELDHQVSICLNNQAFSSLSILCLCTKDTMKSTAYISPRMIHIAPMASPASRFLGEMCVTVGWLVRSLSSPAVLRLSQVARSGRLDPLLAVPGEDGADSASNEHDGSNKVPDSLESKIIKHEDIAAGCCCTSSMLSWMYSLPSMTYPSMRMELMTM